MVYGVDSILQFLRDLAGTRSLGELVNDALESYVSTNLVRDLSSKEDELTSLSEVARKRPKPHGSSVEIIASRRRGHNSRLSR